MAPSVIPPQLKILTAFIRRAEELDNDRQNPDSSLIAYYCRAYAVDKGIKMRVDGAEVNTFLFGLMDSLELSKKTLLINNDSGAVTCENYAHNIFAKADDEYRAGESTKETAKNFYAASSFFDILEQFGPLDEEIIEKRKYSKWKAADILKAIQSGQRPTLPDTPPVSTGSSDFSSGIPVAPTTFPIIASALPQTPFASPPSNNSSYTPPSNQQQQQSIQQQQSLQYSAQQAYPQYTQPVCPPTPVPITGYHGQTGNVSGRTKDALEFAAFAISALKHNDIALAKQRLTAALAALDF